MDIQQRTELLLSGVDKQFKLIEIGASYNPLVPKSGGWNSYTVDHDTREGLVKAYSSHPVDVGAIEEVDFVWKGGPLSEVVPGEHIGTFDRFIASHVIEHSTDLVTFIKSAEQLLQVGGEIILAIPDKRVCFDYFRRLSSTSEVVQAYLDRRSRHRWETFFDCAAYTVFKSNHPGWYRNNMDSVGFDRPISNALAHAETALSEHYVDAHAWVFTPASFRLIILELANLGLINSTITNVIQSEDTEFFVWMKKVDTINTNMKTVNDERVRLQNCILLDLEEQAIQVPGNRQQQLLKKIEELQCEIRRFVVAVDKFL